MLVENAELADIVVRAGKNQEALSEAELRRYLAYQHMFYDTWEFAFSSWQDGILTDGSWTSWNNFFAGEAQRHPDFVWPAVRHHFGAAFQGFVDKSLE